MSCGGSKGAPVTSPPPLPTHLLGPNSFIFMQFYAKTFQNNRLALPAPPPIRSCCPWEILDPPLSNVYEYYYYIL